VISRLSNLAVSDFSKGNNDFPIFRINERFCPFKKLSGSFRSEHDQFKSVGYFLQAIFDRDPGHLCTPLTQSIHSNKFSESSQLDPALRLCQAGIKWELWETRVTPMGNREKNGEFWLVLDLFGCFGFSKGHI